MDIVIFLLISQGLLFGLDLVMNHDLEGRFSFAPENLPQRRIHGVHELLYAAVYIGIAWYAWYGIFSVCMGFMLLIGIFLTIRNFITDSTRHISLTEHVTEIILSMVTGAILALLLPVLVEWYGNLSKVQNTDYGYTSYILTLIGVGTLLLAIRDLTAGIQWKISRSQSVDSVSGVVKWFNRDKGFGFIQKDNGDDIFVHFREIKGTRRKVLFEGQKVKFSISQSKKGPQAVDVTVIGK